jgi:hypothetical protein
MPSIHGRGTGKSLRAHGACGAGPVPAGIAVAAGFSVAAKAQSADLRITGQPSIIYLPRVVMERNKLVEKYAKAQGLDELKVQRITCNSGGAASDALLSGSLDLVTGGVSNLLLPRGRTGCCEDRSRSRRWWPWSRRPVSCIRPRRTRPWSSPASCSKRDSSGSNRRRGRRSFSLSSTICLERDPFVTICCLQGTLITLLLVVESKRLFTTVPEA